MFSLPPATEIAHVLAVGDGSDGDAVLGCSRGSDRVVVGAALIGIGVERPVKKVAGTVVAIVSRRKKHGEDLTRFFGEVREQIHDSGIDVVLAKVHRRVEDPLRRNRRKTALGLTAALEEPPADGVTPTVVRPVDEPGIDRRIHIRVVARGIEVVKADLVGHTV